MWHTNLFRFVCCYMPYLEYESIWRAMLFRKHFLSDVLPHLHDSNDNAHKSCSPLPRTQPSLLSYEYSQHSAVDDVINEDILLIVLWLSLSPSLSLSLSLLVLFVSPSISLSPFLLSLTNTIAVDRESFGSCCGRNFFFFCPAALRFFRVWSD